VTSNQQPAQDEGYDSNGYLRYVFGHGPRPPEPGESAGNAYMRELFESDGQQPTEPPDDGPKAA
jgi:hypothetical protein